MNKLTLPIILSLALIIVTVSIIMSEEDNQSYTLYSTTGCCSIFVDIDTTVKDNPIYTVTYTNNITGDIHTEVETREVDAEWIINTFQEYCYTHHQ